MRKQVKCQYCKQTYFSKVVEVFVKKEILCNKCETPIKNEQPFTCAKCGKVYSKEEFDKLVAHVRASTRSKVEVAKWVAEGSFFEKVIIQENQYCQRCKNYAMRILQKQHNEKLGKTNKNIPITIVPDEDKKAFERKESQWYIGLQIRKEHEEAMQKLQKEKMKAK